MGRQDDHRKIAALRLQVFQHFHPVHARHHQVQQHDIHPAATNTVERLFATFRGLR